MNEDKIFKILESVSKQYEEDSDQCQAIKKAALALHELKHIESEEKFKEFINKPDTPLTGHMLLHLVMMGIEIPDFKKTPELELLKNEIDELAKKISAHQDDGDL
ncbi:MAG: hypothetical protein COA79_19275 [Planctomycetota bacterium]|nr:MAG: hypothetical protein COA79_19275 [Planctomycetota bacterium]